MQIQQIKNPHSSDHHYYRQMISMSPTSDIHYYSTNWSIQLDLCKFCYQLKYNFIASMGTITNYHQNSSFSNSSRWYNILNHKNWSSKRLSVKMNLNNSHKAKHNSHNHWHLYWKEANPHTIFELLNINISVEKNDHLYHWIDILKKKSIHLPTNM